MSDGPRRYELTECDREPIHALNFIQSFGGLVAINQDGTLAYYSENAAELLGIGDGGPKVLALGEPVSRVMRPQAFDRIKRSMAALDMPDGVERIFGLELVNDRTFDCAVHRAGDVFVIEFEVAADGLRGENPMDLLGPLTAQLETAEDLSKICSIGASRLKDILGYDRVMVYRFQEDGTGDVIAEQREPELQSFLGLRYPRTDIPEQARALYLRNRFRIIADVDADPVAILPKRQFRAQPLDLSMSMLRAVSPIHIQYLKNMGVGASLSISIVHQGKLWGLFACHHYSAKPLPFATRTTAELFSQLFSIALDRSLLRKSEQTRKAGQQLHDQLMIRLAQGTSLVENLDKLDELLAETIAHDGMSVLADGVYRARGAAPTREEFETILPALNGSPAGRIIADESLAKHISSARHFADRAAGALIVPISRTPRDYLVLWRRELPQKVVWGGNPDKAVSRSEKGETLTPRSSFAAWEQVVSDQSETWSADDLQIAESLRTTLLEVILKLTDDAERERRKAQEQQSLLIAELNHRVRNILNLIRSLIDQSKHDAVDTEQFVSIVSGRITALATAHENITRENWSPAPLSKLIEAEAKAYLNGKRDRLTLDGDDVLISPQAYTVLALVLHEMVTNSAKYGSLCDNRGALDISLKRSSDGDLVIHWREKDGPPVKQPTRRGFGSTIIERSIPFELQGETDLQFKETGLEAQFRIPSKHIEDIPEAVSSTDAGDSSDPSSAPVEHDHSERPNHLLLIEDSMIIALDTAEVLRNMGIAEVTTCSSTASAFEALERGNPDFAIVDFNLGSETSETVMQKLREREIPFVLATGYGDISNQAEDLGATRVLQKPYGRDDLMRAIPGLSEPLETAQHSERSAPQPGL